MEIPKWPGNPGRFSQFVKCHLIMDVCKYKES